MEARTVPWLVAGVMAILALLLWGTSLEVPQPLSTTPRVGISVVKG